MIIRPAKWLCLSAFLVPLGSPEAHTNCSCQIGPRYEKSHSSNFALTPDP